ncbi:MAG: hypothetical protein COB93_05500 [Sneathiella sp.]|nr:MAG: hypothetical protein COB93_05500 [Sneathiella sp.]
MRPTTRSSFDILYWLRAAAQASGRPVDPAFLIKLLYFAQAVYAAGHEQRKLMPATFLATDAGPIEPDIFLALEQGFSLNTAVALNADAEETLTTIWQICRDKSDTELDLILYHDAAMKAALSRGRNSEIILAEMAAAYKTGWPALGNENAFNKFPDGTAFEASCSTLKAAPNAHQEVRFTADGRSVTKWIPSKRIVSKNSPLLN